MFSKRERVLFRFKTTGLQHRNCMVPKNCQGLEKVLKIMKIARLNIRCLGVGEVKMSPNVEK